MARLGRAAYTPRRLVRAGGEVGVVRVPPTVSVPARTTWNTTTSPRSTSIGGTGAGALAWSAGDRIIVIAGSGDQSTTVATPTGPASLTAFAPIGGPITTSSSCWMQAWAAVATSAGSGVVSFTSGTSTNWGGIAWQVTGATSDGVGSVLAPAASTTSPQTVSLTRVFDDSRVLMLILDWGAGVGGVGTVPSPRNWTPSAGVSEWEAFGVSGTYNGYAADWGDQSAAGTTSYGINVAGSGANYTILAVEVLGRAVVPSAAVQVESWGMISS